MKVTQIKDLLNEITSTILGKTDVVNEDLTNVADIGVEIFNATDVDNYVKTLVDKIGKVIFTDRKYSGSVPSVYMDGWEFGAVTQKISAEMPQAEENDSWSLTDGHSYDVNVFHKPTVSNKFFSKKITFEIPMSFTERQVKSAFNSATELNSFLSMIVTSIENSMTVKIDNLIMRTINSMIGQTLLDEYGDKATDFSPSKVKAVNLLTLYNATVTTPVKVPNALSDSGFVKFATYTINLYKDRLSKMSTLFNVGGKERFTPSDQLVTVLLSDFKASSTVNVLSDSYNKEYVQLPNADVVPYWQGSGQDYSLANVSKIMVELDKKTVAITGILGVMFDKQCLGVCNTSRRVTTNYNAKGEFYNNYYKYDAGYFNDLNENFVVFFMAEKPTTK